jgi:hypothetical protein
MQNHIIKGIRAAPFFASIENLTYHFQSCGHQWPQRTKHHGLQNLLQIVASAGLFFLTCSTSTEHLHTRCGYNQRLINFHTSVYTQHSSTTPYSIQFQQYKEEKCFMIRVTWLGFSNPCSEIEKLINKWIRTHGTAVKREIKTKRWCCVVRVDNKTCTDL